MGICKLDIHAKERIFECVSFSDIDCIKGLIKYRHIIDSYLGISKNYNIYEAGDVAPVNQELICIYIDLDNLINRCKLTDKQKKIVDMYMNGYSEKDISLKLNKNKTVIEKILNTICEKIKKINDTDWKYNYVYMNYKKVEWSYKTCNRCGEKKPAINEFFSLNSSSSDGLYSICKDCK